MQLYQTLKEHLQKHNRHLFTKRELSKLLNNTEGAREIAYPNHNRVGAANNRPLSHTGHADPHPAIHQEILSP